MNGNENVDYQSEKIHRFRFTPKEDKKLISLVKKYGTNNWNAIAQNLPQRTARQCRDRWNHYVNPQTNTSEWHENEDEIIINSLKQYGKQWTLIASFLPGRTSVAVRNRSCKLSRRCDADPYIKNLLKDEYKKKNKNQNIQNEACEEQETTIIKKRPQLPSCLELLEKLGQQPFIFPILI